MKAKEYFEKYGDKIANAQSEEAYQANIMDLIKDFHAESSKIITDRKCTKEEAIVGVIREMNDKWNAIVSMFEKKYAFSPLKYDAYLEIQRHRIPRLNDFWVYGRQLKLFTKEAK